MKRGSFFYGVFSYVMSSEDSDGVLHRGAMEGAVLADEDAAVNGNDVVAGKSLLELGARQFIVGRLAIGGHQDGTVDDQEVGVGGRKAMAIVGVVDGRWQREGDEVEEPRPLRPLSNSPRGGERTCGGVGEGQSLELLLHGVEGLIVLVIWIGTLYVSDCVVGTEAGEGVNMAVCIIASEVAMIEPEDALGMEIAQEAFFYLLPVKVWITLR